MGARAKPRSWEEAKEKTSFIQPGKYRVNKIRPKVGKAKAEAFPVGKGKRERRGERGELRN